MQPLQSRHPILRRLLKSTESPGDHPAQPTLPLHQSSLRRDVTGGQQFRRRAGSRRAQIGHEIGDRKIHFVPHGGDHRQR